MSTAPPSTMNPRLSGPMALALLFISMGLCGFVDYATGYEVSVFALYVVPIILGMRLFGTSAGVAVAVGCALVWLVADQQSGHRYEQPWVLYWNALHRLFFFLCVVLAFHHVRLALTSNARRLRALAGPIPFCAQCHRIGADDGHWHRFESYLGEQVGAQPLRKVCPDCAREAYAKAGIAEHASHR